MIKSIKTDYRPIKIVGHPLIDFRNKRPQDRVNKALEIYNNIKKSKAHGGMVMRNYYDYEPRSI